MCIRDSTIGDLHTINAGVPQLHLPQLSFDLFREQIPNGFTIAILAAIESLLSCVVADSMISSHHRANMELVAQGVGNIGSALFGGIPATGAIARTAANVKALLKHMAAQALHMRCLLYTSGAPPCASRTCCRRPAAGSPRCRAWG